MEKYFKGSQKKRIIIIIGIIVFLVLTAVIWQAVEVKIKTTKLKFKDNGDYYGVMAYDNLLTGEIVIPETYRGKPVQRIEYGGFSSCLKLTDIKIPDSVTAINDYAFHYCVNLNPPIIPESVTYIGAHAFSSCNKFTSFDVPDSVTEIGEYAFSDCYNLTGVKLSDNINIISAYSFLNCTSLKTISIPDSVTSVEGSAFRSGGLEYVTIPSAVNSISSMAFYDCQSLAEITTSGGIKDIGWRAFENTAWLSARSDGPIYLDSVLYAYKGNTEEITEFTVTEGTISLSASVFNDFENLQKLNLAASVEHFDFTGLYHCFKLTEVNVHEANSEYSSVNGVVLSKDMTELVYFPRAIEGDYTIPSTVSCIRPYAFEATYLSKIIIPASVTEIGSNNLLSTKNLEMVIINSTTPPDLSEYDFDEIFDGYETIPPIILKFNILVPAESLNSYKSAANWSTFGDYIKAINVGDE